MKVTLPRWLMGDLIALDELGNAVVLKGNAHETTSAHCGAQLWWAKAQPSKYKICPICKFVIWFTSLTFSPNHCENAYLDEKKLIADSVGLVGVDPNNPSGK